MTEYIPNLPNRLPKWITGWCLLGLDLLAGWLAFDSVFAPYLLATNASVWLWYASLEFLWIGLFLLGNLYRGEFTTSRVIEFETILKITFSVVALIILLQSLTVVQTPFPPPALFRYWFWFTAALLLFRMVVRTTQKALLKRGVGREHTVIIGCNPRGYQAAETMSQQYIQGYDLVGFIQAADDPEPGEPPPLPVLGSEPDLQHILQQHHISDVVLALDKPDTQRLMNVIAGINGSPVTVKIVPGLYDVISGLARTEQIVGLPLLEVNMNLESWYLQRFKRILDLIIALPLGLVALPLALVVAAAVKLDSPGPVLYRQVRVGRRGSPFTIYKFRSMVKDAEQLTGPVWSEEDDPRITKVGRILRRFRLDELPQLWNVVKGDMSLVGPRPERPYFVEKLMQEFPFYARRLRVRPGITGWAQIKHPYDRNITDVRQKLKYDFYYLENISLNLDLKILVSTVWVMITGRGR
ncbi:MAG: sugar transferase [Candidatus Neomarinimicrobiota bacterium]|nr:MAG: sugar transferase [Candidatus Neomarinimicrobiota bacterium]